MAEAQHGLVDNPKNPVKILQDFCDSTRLGVSPKFELLSIEGNVHQPFFKYRVLVGGHIDKGTGHTKQEAMQSAARAVLKKIAPDDDCDFDSSDEALPRKGVVSELTESDTESEKTEDPRVLGEVVQAPASGATKGFDNPVGALQELCMRHGWILPRYEMISVYGPPHSSTFTMRATLNRVSEQARGKCKKDAKREAARKLLERVTANMTGDEPVVTKPPKPEYQPRQRPVIEEMRGRGGSFRGRASYRSRGRFQGHYNYNGRPQSEDTNGITYSMSNMRFTPRDEPPSRTTDKRWLMAYSRSQQLDNPEFSGKWMLFVSSGIIDDVWNCIKTETECNRLGPKSKVSTAMETRNGQHVICVHTVDSRDVEDIMRVRQHLRSLGFDNKIGYKTDDATRAGRFGQTGPSVNKYYC